VTAAAHPAPARHAVGASTLWFGLFGAPLAWSVQELAGYAVMSHACYPSWQPLQRLGSPGPWPATLAVSGVMLLVGLAAGLLAFRSWRLTRALHREERHHPLEHGEGRARFMALGGLILSSIFLGGIAMNTLVLFRVSPC
jgi:hypothetical protein